MLVRLLYIYTFVLHELGGRRRLRFRKSKHERFRGKFDLKISIKSTRDRRFVKKNKKKMKRKINCYFFWQNFGKNSKIGGKIFEGAEFREILVFDLRRLSHGSGTMILGKILKLW